MGLYGPGGGFPNLQTSDSVFVVQITRNTTPDSTVTLEILRGGIQTSALTGTEQSFAEIEFFVYPDSNSAKADPQSTGVGSSYMGKVTLNGASGTLTIPPGLQASDFIVTTAGGKTTARVKPGGITKVVSVPSPANAVIRIKGDARSQPVVPGQSPLILVLMTLALLGSGLWAIRSRRMSSAA